MPGAATQSFFAGGVTSEHRAETAGKTAPSVEVLTDFAAARPVFESLYAHGHATPYQRLDWIESYFRHVDAPRGARAAIIVLRAGNGEPRLLLPLAVLKKGPVSIASFIGGKHSNFNMPLFAPGASAPDAAQLSEALKRAASIAGIDLYALMAQPLEWEGTVNPLAALGGQPSASAGYKLSLASDGEALLQGRLSKDTRKKLRQKEQKLAALAPVTYRRPETAEEARAVLDAFLALKAQRFGAQGIDDPFAGDDIRRFLEEAVTQNFASGPAVELHALMLGDKPVSIYGGLTGGKRFCGLFTAFDGTTEIARSTPGDILLMAMIKECCKRGFDTFDLGVGEARYKMQVCDQREALIDTFVPASFVGRAAATGLSVAQNAKRRIKQSAAATQLIAKFRKLRAKG